MSGAHGPVKALKRPVLCIVGPTASGKTDLAQAVALAHGGEVVSADSMQVYRGMDIGTGKIPEGERQVPHHCLDLADPGDPFSAALFQQEARRSIEAIDGRGSLAVLCGGTGFYVRAAIDDYCFPAGEQVGNPVRDRLTIQAQQLGPQALWEQLEQRDPASAALIAPNDVKRVVRAFELLEEGESYARQREKLASIGPFYPAVMIGIAVEPELLRQRIDRRVDAMMEAGLANEVQGLLDGGFRDAVTAPQAIGYKEVAAALEGRCTMDEAVEAVKGATRRYAKRQRTWFRKDRRIHWVNGDEGSPEALLARAEAILATIG